MQTALLIAAAFAVRVALPGSVSAQQHRSASVKRKFQLTPQVCMHFARTFVLQREFSFACCLRVEFSEGTVEFPSFFVKGKSERGS